MQEEVHRSHCRYVNANLSGSVVESIKAIQSRQDMFQTTFEGFEPEALHWLQDTVTGLCEAHDGVAVQRV